ncbi:M61 family metallopeptidase [Mucilaginibacter sp. AK015]|uniref:M61 family metallopeptidase n=1 Tax=Mucilaginibacter sp. AK015 TaxID=2723072 RepID=UPI00161123BC|nr:PDZ domain-containing protein [Mucilaginibacter sp. AK015]MBB5396744.1 putative metalloprotease with PDZ domain [Mucilaginibacter sp. AK015]
MKKFQLSALVYLILFFMSTTPGNAAGIAKISYTVSFPEAQAHYVDVEMNITGLAQPSLEVKMPVWAPGSYLVREFAKNIESLSVFANGKPVPAPKINKNTWRINTAGHSSVTVKYKVYAFELSVRTSFIDVSHAFLSTTGIFLFPKGMLNQPSTITIKPYKDWNKVSTSLEMVKGGVFTRTAPNYDILYDSPLEIGTQDVFDFDVDGTHYEVAMYGGGNYDKERLKVDMAKIIRAEAAIYGENPNKHYTFIVHNKQRNGGGLEHLSSTVLGASRDQYGNERGYRGFLGLVAHEHFHLWNVKRLRPIALGPFDYDNENYTTNLWIAEGFTAYYQNLALRYADLTNAEGFLGDMAGDINTVENQPGTKVQPLAESSFDAWIKGYRPNENSYNTGISYYDKGAVVGMLLDLAIINGSNGKYSLNDVMRYMYNTYYKTKKRGYTDAEFKAGFEKFAGSNLDDFYAKYINGLAPIDYNKYLGYAGYKLVDALAETNEPTLGVFTNQRNIISTVIRDGAGWVDGLNVGDQITHIDDTPVTDLAAAIKDKKVGDKIVVTVSRDGQGYKIPVTLKRNTAVKYSITELPNPTPQQLAVRKKWLKM